MPDAFPHHSHGAPMLHISFNELAATIDHLVPITLGGADMNQVGHNLNGP
jgi:hypothetical protein